MSVCVFCGSSKGLDPKYMQLAADLGTQLARQHVRLVYGGLMGEVARNAGDVIGVIPKPFIQLCEPMIGRTIEVDDMHQRKRMFLSLASGFIALPGGAGTFEELLECITWKQLGIHSHPVIVLDPFGFYDPLKALILKGIKEGFIANGFNELVTFCKTIDEALDVLRQGDSVDHMKLGWIPISKAKI